MQELLNKRPEQPADFSFDIDLGMINRLYKQKIVDEPRQAGETVEDGQSEQEDDEYDPTKPNDYEKVLRDRELFEEEERRRVELEDFRIKENLLDPAVRHQKPQEQVQILDENGPLIDKKIIKMLEKHGWEYGKGFGAEENGMLNPIIPVKTSSHTAILKPVESSHLISGSEQPKDPKKNQKQADSTALPQTHPNFTVIYQSKSVVDDPRIAPIQEKYFRA